MSWGVKITILYIGFVVLILSMVAMTMRQKVDLVSKDYYAQELNFQNKIDQSNRANALVEPLNWIVSNGKIEINFPKEFKNQKITGTINLFRPSDASLDKKIAVSSLQNGKQIISTSTLKAGVYKIQIEWNVGEESFYNEGVIKI